MKAAHDHLAESEASHRSLVADLTETVERLKGLSEVSRAVTSNLEVDEVLKGNERLFTLRG